MRASRRLRTIIVAATFSIISTLMVGCCTRKEGVSYRFELEYDAAPSAYRNTVNAGERLSIPIRIRNLSDYGIPVTDDNSSQPKGLIVRVTLLKPHEYLDATEAKIDYGFEAGACLKAIQDAQHTRLFDHYNNAVADLARVAHPLLGMDRDAVTAGFHALANEVQIRAEFPVKWGLVPTTPAVIQAELLIQTTFVFIDGEGHEHPFDKTFQERVPISFLNTVRGARDFRPGAEGPKTGSFKE